MAIYGDATFLDTTHIFDSTGIIIASSILKPEEKSFFQDTILGSEEPLRLDLFLIDRTYTGGYWDTTMLRDSTKWDREFNPIWITYSIWQDSSTEEQYLEGYRYREPVNESVGDYYATMEVPHEPGPYEIRWRYLKEPEVYAKEIREPFNSLSKTDAT